MGFHWSFAIHTIFAHLPHTIDALGNFQTINQQFDWHLMEINSDDCAHQGDRDNIQEDFVFFVFFNKQLFWIIFFFFHFQHIILRTMSIENLKKKKFETFSLNFFIFHFHYFPLFFFFSYLCINFPFVMINIISS